MPLTLLDGTTAAVSMKIGSAQPPTVEYNCSMRYLSADIVRDFTEATTFCQSGWRTRTPGMKQLVGRMDGYASKGDPSSGAGILTASTVPLNFIFTLDTLCTFTGAMHVGREHFGIQAAAQSERGIDWESAGVVTIAWVIA